MASTLGQQMRHSAQTAQLLDGLVEQVLSFSKRIDGVKGPDSACEAGMAKDIQTIGQVRSRPLFYNYLGSGLGNGPYVELEDGSVKLDLINGIGVHLFGHSHPRIVRASLSGALSDVVQQGNLAPNVEYAQFSEQLGRIVAKNSRMRHVWLATCGTMANESALKIARQKMKGARMIITFKNAFAGRSTLMTEVTDNPSFKVGIPQYDEVLRLPFYSPNDPPDKTLNVLKEHVAKHGKNICCFMFEPMLGEGGYRAATREFFVPLLEFCRSQGIPIWADEIQTFTRTGNFFAFETLGIAEYIDICTIAKTAQNGATMFTPEFKPDPGLLGGTFSGSTPALRAGMEILKMIEEEGYLGPDGKIMQIHREFIGMLNELNTTTCKGLLREAGGMGLMVAVTPLDGSKDKQLALLKSLYKNGLMCFGCGSDPYRIRFLIPAIVTSKDIQVAKKIIEKSVLELA
ncbi:MAG: aminotransferase class III-fold pyridoxal phosphate-dependent enzyme [Bdellovibrionales bacterium]|nr:aminotransferase class III-fold pyridoxal phosphate-dependent enzyme [Bdellovibrionales bacterium]